MKKLLLLFVLALPALSSAQQGNSIDSAVLAVTTLEDSVFSDIKQAKIAQMQWAMLGLQKQTTTGNALIISSVVLAAVVAGAPSIPILMAATIGTLSFAGAITLYNANKWHQRAAFLPVELPDGSGYIIRKRIR